jgi:hypothetical protein
MFKAAVASVTIEQPLLPPRLTKTSQPKRHTKTTKLQ